MEAAPTDGLFGDSGPMKTNWELAMTNLNGRWNERPGHDCQDFDGREKKVFELFVHLHQANRHKMIPIPVLQKSPSLWKQ